MTLKKYVVKDSVFGDFGFEASTPVHYDDVRIVQDEKIFRLFYSFESEKSFKEIMDDLLHRHLNLPDLVSATIGSRWTQYQIDLYEEGNNGYELVGQSGEVVHEAKRRNSIFPSVQESFQLLKRIICVQIGYSSRRRDRILTALNLAGISGQYWESIHQWAWNALEWFLRALADRTGFTALFDYKLNENENTARVLFHERMRDAIRTFSEELQNRSIDDAVLRKRLDKDIEWLVDLAESFNIQPSIMEIFDHCFGFFQEAIDEYAPKITDSTLALSFQSDYGDKRSIESLVRDAKKVRDGFIHDDKRAWKRADNPMIDETFRFRQCVSVLLLVAMTRPPEHFDSTKDSIGVTKLPEEFSSRPPSRNVEEGVYGYKVRNSDGSLTTHEVDVDIKRWDYKTRELEITPRTKVVLGQASCTVTCSNVEFVGTLDLGSLPSLTIKIRRWYYI